jgi:hypothetical protein
MDARRKDGISKTFSLGTGQFFRAGVSEPGDAERSAFTADVPNLDYLRAFAVGLVLLSHFAGMFGLLGYGFAAIGHFGVLIFFVHTTLVLSIRQTNHIFRATHPFDAVGAWKTKSNDQAGDEAAKKPIDWRPNVKRAG